jgi:enterochelin esterase family protein
MLAIETLAQSADVSPVAIDAFLEEHGFPIVEGRQVTFVFRGPAHGVFLQHWIHALPQQQPLRRLAGTDLWYLTLELPRRSRIEYKFGLEQGGPPGAHGHGPRAQLVLDPLNPHAARDPFGANSVVHTEGYEVPAWTQPNEEARAGEIHEHQVLSEAFGDSRPLQVYLPARYRPTRRYPLLIVHDGEDFLRFAGLKTVLDNLIDRLEIPPLVCALTTSPRRLEEYPNDERHARFVAEELVPLMEERYSLLPDPGARGLLGSSFGAVAALSTAWRYPGVFDRLCLLSGSFLFTDIGEHEGGPAFDAVVEFVNAFRKEPGRPARQVFASCGVYEPMIYYNRSMVPVFQSTGMRVRFVEARDGHNWENWRDRLREGLSWLFPGPLWMVYE